MFLRLTRGRFDPACHDEVVPVLPDMVTAICGLPGVQ